MSKFIAIETADKDDFIKNIELLASAIDNLKEALSKAEPLAISDAAYRVIEPYDAMSKQAELILNLDPCESE